MKRDLSPTALRAPRHGAAEVFGYFWEMVHQRSGTVVGEGFSRHWPALRRQPGYGYRLTRLARIREDDAWAPGPER